jgi:hypothetical protein
MDPVFKEKLITIMEISPDNGEERIAALERKIRDMEALVKGLTAEVLDMKAAAMAVSRADGERSRQQLKQAPAVRGISPVLTARPAAMPVAGAADEITALPSGALIQEELPTAPVATPEPAMVRIMQPDGTMKLEPRYGTKKMI